MEERNKKLALICGATGFIGRNVLAWLASDPRFIVRATAYNRPPPDGFPGVDWRTGDLRDPSYVREILDGVDVVFHFAATTSGAKDILSKPYIHVTDNAVMTSLLMREAFERCVKHFIFPSCTIMYKSSADLISEGDFDPASEMNPIYFGAGQTKVYLEKMCEFYSRVGGTRFTVIRHSNIYGPHDKFDLEKSHVFGATITKVLTAKDGVVTVWGTGEERRDLLYVDDLIEFIKLAIVRQKESFGLFNVGSGVGVSIMALVRDVINASGRKLSILCDDSKPSIPTSVILDCRKAFESLGWRPHTSLEQGIRSTLLWVVNNKMGKDGSFIDAR